MKISYYKTENVALDRLHEIQGKLKELTQVNFDRLWKSMSRNDIGFAEPFVVWECKEENKIYVVGGHQRLRILNAKKKQGEKLPARFPCNFTRCKDKAHAIQLCLYLASQYGRVTDEGLYQVAIDNEIEPDFLKENFEFPGLNMDIFIQGYFEDGDKIDDPEKEWEGMPEFEQEAIEPYKKLIVNFRNKEDMEEFSNLIKQTINIETKFIYYPKLIIEKYGEIIG